MTDQEKICYIDESEKMTYFLLCTFGEIIMVLGKGFYHLFNSTLTKGAYMECERAANGFPSTLYETVSICCIFNVFLISPLTAYERNSGNCHSVPQCIYYLKSITYGWYCPL